MPRLSDHIENALNETRMLLLGAQVLLGFSYRICFEPVFDSLPAAAQISEAVALTVMTAGLVWLMWPAAFHRISEHGLETERIHSFTTQVLDWALLPFCLGLAFAFYPLSLALRVPHPLLIAIAIGCVTFMAWYGWGLLRRARRKSMRHSPAPEGPPLGSDLADRIKKVLIECRMALPGAQAFLGFQLSIVFTESFQQLPRSSQWIHFISLLTMTFSIVLLIAPAAYHRLAEAGEDTDDFLTVANYLLLAGIAFLAPGIAGDLFIVLRKISGSTTESAIVAGGLLILCYALWFGLSLLKKSRRSPESIRPAKAA